LKIKCGICHEWGLFGGVILHPKTGWQTTRCTTCRDEVVVSRQLKTYKPSTTSEKQEEKQ